MRLGTLGLVGYDPIGGSYFHRELPFDREKIESQQPRLKAARGLVAAEAVELDPSPDATDPAVSTFVAATVRGSRVDHRVELSGGGAGDRCTCRWYRAHRGGRGPCKHVLAVRLAVRAAEEAA